MICRENLDLKGCVFYEPSYDIPLLKMHTVLFSGFTCPVIGLYHLLQGVFLTKFSICIEPPEHVLLVAYS